MEHTISIILLLGAVQGLFIAAVTGIKRDNLLINKILSILLTVFSVDMIVFLVIDTGLFVDFPVVIGSTYAFPFLYGPIFYFFCEAVTHKHEKFRNEYYFHLVPFAVIGFMFVPFYFKGNTEKIVIMQEYIQSGASTDIFPNFIHLFGILHYFVYILLSFKSVENYERRVVEFYSEYEKKDLFWIRSIIGIHILAVIVVFLFFLDHIFGYNHHLIKASRIFYVFMTFVNYLIAFYVIRYPGIFKQTFSISEMLTQGDELASSVTSARYEKSRISDEMMDRYKKRLIDFIEQEKPYCDSSLNLQQLAKKLHAPPHHLSQVINISLKQNFYSFINGYRIEEAKRLLMCDKYKDENILSIAYQSGFNSKSAFNTYFKKITGLTPTQFRKNS